MNGLSSVIAPRFALLLAVTNGFGMVLVVAAGLYAVAYGAGRRI